MAQGKIRDLFRRTFSRRASPKTVAPGVRIIITRPGHTVELIDVQTLDVKIEEVRRPFESIVNKRGVLQGVMEPAPKHASVTVVLR